ENVRPAVAVPVGGGEGGVTPFGLTGSLDGTAWSCQNAKRLALGRFEEDGGGPFGEVVLPFTEIFEKGDVAGGVAAEDVVETVAVPVDHVGGREGTELEGVGLLLKEYRLVENGKPVPDLAAVFDQGDPAVLVSDDEIDVPVAGPVVGGRGDHLHVHDERL